MSPHKMQNIGKLSIALVERSASGYATGPWLPQCAEAAVAIYLFFIDTVFLYLGSDWCGCITGKSKHRLVFTIKVSHNTELV